MISKNSKTRQKSWQWEKKNGVNFKTTLLSLILVTLLVFPSVIFAQTGDYYQEAYSFEDGEMYLIVGISPNSGGKYALDNVKSGNYLKASSIEVQGDHVLASSVNATMVWTAEKEGEYTYLKNGGGYLHRVSGGDNINADETTKHQGRGGWMYNATNSMLYTISTTSGAPDHPFYLEYSSGNGYFKIDYESTHTEFVLYKLVGGVAVKGVTLNKPSLELEVDESETLIATVAPADADNKNVIWSSSNLDVATVDSQGEVVAWAAGNAVITVTTVDGEFTATANVTVKEKAPILTGWVSDNDTWYYYKADGQLAKGWLQTGGKWYYLDPENGSMQVGWKNVNGKWYYMNPSGAMRVGWLQNGGKWYYLNINTGAMQTGWVQSNGKWYYMNKNTGAMQTGWVQSNGKWYYLEASGAMAVNKWIGGKYYVRADGAMLVNSWTPDGYYVGEDGAWVKGASR